MSNTTKSASAAGPIDALVGARIRLRRTLLGMSQEKLGAALGLTFQQVQKYERGANKVGASRLYEMSRVLDVPIGFFSMMSEQVLGNPARLRRSHPGLRRCLQAFVVEVRQQSAHLHVGQEKEITSTWTRRQSSFCEHSSASQTIR